QFSDEEVLRDPHQREAHLVLRAPSSNIGKVIELPEGDEIIPPPQAGSCAGCKHNRRMHRNLRGLVQQWEEDVYDEVLSRGEVLREQRSWMVLETRKSS